MASQASDTAAVATPDTSSLLAEGDAEGAGDAVEGTPEETPEKNKAKRKRTKKPKETAEERLHRLHPEVKGGKSSMRVVVVISLRWLLDFALSRCFSRSQFSVFYCLCLPLHAIIP
jgi:hypothetical protein